MYLRTQRLAVFPDFVVFRSQVSDFAGTLSGHLHQVDIQWHGNLLCRPPLTQAMTGIMAPNVQAVQQRLRVLRAGGSKSPMKQSFELIYRSPAKKQTIQLFLSS
jgi:hypothetical protein